MYAFGEFVGCQEALHSFISATPFAITDTTFALLCLYLFMSRLRETNRSNDKDVLYVTNKLTILQVATMGIHKFVSMVYLGLPITGMLGIDASVNTVCLILSVKAYDEWYKKLCFLCRYCCEKETMEEAIVELTVSSQDKKKKKRMDVV